MKNLHFSTRILKAIWLWNFLLATTDSLICLNILSDFGCQVMFFSRNASLAQLSKPDCHHLGHKTNYIIITFFCAKFKLYNPNFSGHLSAIVHERALSNPFPFFFSFFWVSFRGSGSAHFTSMGLLENSECESTLPSRFKLCARAVAVLHSRTPTYNEHLVTVAGAEIRIYSDIWDGKKWDLCHAEQS